MEAEKRTGVVQCECLRKRIVEAKMNSVSSRFKHCSLDNFTPKDRVHEAAVAEIIKNPAGSFFFHGSYGRGKTHLAVAQFRILAELGHPCLFLSMAELLKELNRAELDKEYFCTVIERVQSENSFHLFLDDIDKFKPTDFKFQVLFDVIDTVYKRNLSITVTTNWTMEDLVRGERLHPAVVRRLDDMCTCVEV